MFSRNKKAREIERALSVVKTPGAYAAKPADRYEVDPPSSGSVLTPAT